MIFYSTFFYCFAFEMTKEAKNKSVVVTKKEKRNTIE